jgi:Bacterial Ig domain/RTX calcium-binding nonapeptide repeat (4 copies)
MRIAAVCALVALLACAGALRPSAGAGADDGTCSTPVTYPGDDASREAIAEWMARGARARGLPGELPVMASLVESGLTNLQGSDRDSVGFFQMRVSIWNQGPYAGFPDNPELQLTWFVDQALAVLRQRIASGLPTDPSAYGDWIADVERPPEEFRGRYQLRLDEARGLVSAACVGLPPAVAAAPDGYGALQAWPLTVPAPGVLANDTRASSAQLVSGPTHGTLALSADGGFTYVGAEDFVGTDSFSYTASDGLSSSAPATVTLTVRAACNGRPATIVGTEGRNTLVGTPGPDVIVGLGGSDILLGGGGDDQLCGGSGLDALTGGPGSDALNGGSGSDLCLGGLGADTAVACETTLLVP